MKYLSAQRVTGTVSHWHEKVEGGLVLPLTRHTMAITTQLTLSIYTTVHRHTWAHKQQCKEWKRLFSKTLYWSCDFDSYTCCRTCEIKHEEHLRCLMPISCLFVYNTSGKFKWKEKEQNFNLERVGAINPNVFPFTQRLLLKLHWCNIKCYNLGKKMRWVYE